MPLQLVCIRPLAPCSARPRPTAVTVDLAVVGPRGALYFSGGALGRVRGRRLWLAPGHHRIEVGARGRGWSRDFELPAGAHAQLRIDVAPPPDLPLRGLTSQPRPSTPPASRRPRRCAPDAGEAVVLGPRRFS